MKNFFSCGVIMSLVLSILVVPGMFSTLVFADSDWGPKEVNAQTNGIFAQCNFARQRSGNFSVSSNNPATKFILNLLSSCTDSEPLLSSTEVTGAGAINFNFADIFPNCFGVTNRANDSDVFTGSLRLVPDSGSGSGSGTIVSQCIEWHSSAASFLNALSAGLLTLIGIGVPTIFS